jgi:hypothetical protein
VDTSSLPEKTQDGKKSTWGTYVMKCTSEKKVEGVPAKVITVFDLA